jgi:hypothetical protein
LRTGVRDTCCRVREQLILTNGVTKFKLTELYILFKPRLEHAMTEVAQTLLWRYMVTTRMHSLGWVPWF